MLETALFQIDSRFVRRCKRQNPLMIQNLPKRIRLAASADSKQADDAMIVLKDPVDKPELFFCRPIFFWRMPERQLLSGRLIQKFFDQPFTQTFFFKVHRILAISVANKAEFPQLLCIFQNGLGRKRHNLALFLQINQIVAAFEVTLGLRVEQVVLKQKFFDHLT